MTWLDVVCIGAAIGLVGYIAWGIWRLHSLDMTDIDADLGE